VNLAHTEAYHELHKTVSGLKNMGSAVRVNVFENVASVYRLITVTILIVKASVILVPRPLMSCLSFVSDVDQT